MIELIIDIHNNNASPLNSDFKKALASNFLELNQRSKEHALLYRDVLLIFYKCKCYKLLRDKQLLIVIKNIVLWSKRAKRDLRKWIPKSKSANKQVRELLHYAFVLYEMPVCMDKIWGMNRSLLNHWYVLIGEGMNPRSLPELPISLTKKMAMYFLNAPSNLDVYQSIRWAQVMAISKENKVLASHISMSYLGRNQFENDDFWIRLIHLCVQAETVTVKEIRFWIDYLRAERQENEKMSLKGRTLTTINRDATKWHHQQVRINKRGGKHVWASRELHPFFSSISR